MPKRLLRHAQLHRLMAALLGRYLAFALRSTRWTLHGAEHVAPHLTGRPAVVAFWHERLPLMPALLRQAQRGRMAARVHVLVSRHSDGRFIGDLVRRFGVEPVHGSTARFGRDRGGAAALKQMLERLAAGEHVALTPDGPRGPRRVAAPGVAQLAALSGAPVLPCAAQISRRRTLGTWDRMVLPLPFGCGVIVCGPAIPVGRAEAGAALPAIAAALSAVADQADRLCP
jgi:lysophospholipid acyltransferase (LPLAT)-like uncharacterized protein